MQRGDRAAFRRILDRQLGPVTNYVKRMLPASADVEDIVQETFVRLWTHRTDYDPSRASLTTWLHRVAHNLCMDEYRRRRPEAQDPAVIESATDGPDRSYDDDLARQQIATALSTLDERQRSALVLTHYQGLPQQDVAAILDLSVDALESLLRRSRQKLRLALKAAGGAAEPPGGTRA